MDTLQNLKECYVIGDATDFSFSPIGAGLKYPNSKWKQDIVDAALQVQKSWHDREIENP